MNLDAVGAVFQLIMEGMRVERELARLADRHESGVQLQRQRGGEDETTRLRGDDGLDAAITKRSGELVDRLAKRLRRGKQWRNIAKQNARFGKIGDIANERLEVHGHGVLLCGELRREYRGKPPRQPRGPRS